MLNVALPSVDVYSDIALVVNFLVGSRSNPYCDELYPTNRYGYYYQEYRLNCYYNDSVPTANVTYTSHYGWASMMFVPFIFNYLICWYVWATTGITSQLHDTQKIITKIIAHQDIKLPFKIYTFFKSVFVSNLNSYVHPLF